MPTPRSHGGAALAMIPMTVPGFKGLNTDQASGILGTEWATLLQNAVIDSNNRVAARKGWSTSTGTPVAKAFTQLHIYEKHDGTSYIIASAADALYSSSNSGSTWTDVTNAIAFTAGNWQFVNYNDKVYGIQQGEALIEGAGGNFTQLSVTDVPSGNALCAAFGRLWASRSDGTTLAYSALLDGTDWSGADAGVFDLTNVWRGTDTIQAITEFNGLLVVFGKNNIVFYTDGKGSALGIDPVEMYVVDIVSGTGCIARDSIQLVDGDLWFLSFNGLQSLGRVVQERSNPLDNISKNVQDALLAEAVTSGYDLNKLRSAYSPRDRFYLLSLPDYTGASGGAFVFDTRGKMEDGSARCMGTWTLAPTGIAVTRNSVVYMSIVGPTGEVGTYSGATDDGTSYDFQFETGWLDLTQQGFLLFPKRYSGIFFTDADISVNFKWAFDFDESFKSRARSFQVDGAALYGTAVWGTDVYGGGVSLRDGKVPAAGNGQYVKLGISATITGTTFAVQQLNLFCKIGRYQ